MTFTAMGTLRNALSAIGRHTARPPAGPAYAIFALTAVLLVLYSPVAHFGFVNFDDDIYVTANRTVQRGVTREGLRWAAGATLGFWQPIVWLSHMVDCTLFGMNAGGHHLVNLVLHAANVILLFILLRTLTSSPWASVLVASMFALHPLNVESVAWISERKGLLAGFFLLLTLLLYVLHLRTGRKWVSILSVTCFMLGLMSKPVLVVLPALLLLLDYWPLRRFVRFHQSRLPHPRQTSDQPPLGAVRASKSLLKVFRATEEKAPYLVGACMCVFIAFGAENAVRALPGTDELTINARIVNCVASYCTYVARTAAPFHLAAFYPLPRSEGLSLSFIAGAVFLTLTSLAAFKLRRECPYFLVGWLFYLICLAPNNGIIQIGHHLTADRYAYVPTIGLFIAVAWGLRDLVAAFPKAACAIHLATVAALAGFAALSRHQLSYWSDSISLWTQTLRVTGGSSLAFNNLGNCYERSGAFGEAIANYRRALRIEPKDPALHCNLAVALERSDRISEALAHYLEALRLDPSFPPALMGLRYYVVTKTPASLCAGVRSGTETEFPCLPLSGRAGDYADILAGMYVKNGQPAEAERVRLIVAQRVAAGDPGTEKRSVEGLHARAGEPPASDHRIP